MGASTGSSFYSASTVSELPVFSHYEKLPGSEGLARFSKCNWNRREPLGCEAVKECRTQQQAGVKATAAIAAALTIENSDLNCFWRWPNLLAPERSGISR